MKAIQLTTGRSGNLCLPGRRRLSGLRLSLLLYNSPYNLGNFKPPRTRASLSMYMCNQ